MHLRQSELDRKLGLFQGRALELLCLERMLEAECLTRKIVLPANLPSRDNLAGVEAYLDVLLTQLSRARVSAADARAIYADFHRELAKREFLFLFVPTEGELKTVREDLKSGKPFEQVMERSRDTVALRPNLPVGQQTLSQLATYFTPQQLELLAGLREREVSPPLETEHGYLLAQLTSLKDTFDELSPDIYGLACGSLKLTVMRDIVSRSAVSTSEHNLRLYRNLNVWERARTPLRPNSEPPHSQQSPITDLPPFSVTATPVPVPLPKPDSSGKSVIPEFRDRFQLRSPAGGK